MSNPVWPRYVPQELKPAILVAKKAYTAEREIVLFPLSHFREAKKRGF
jgi:hypothetical protein